LHRDTAGQERYKVVSHSVELHTDTEAILSSGSSSRCSLWYVAFPFQFVVLILVKAPMYYRNANCAVVVYDITQSASLEKARNWIRELQRQADPSIVIALCGNKSDLAVRRQVTQEEAQKYAQEEGLMWAETSAKTGDGVTDIFTRIGQSIPQTSFIRFGILLSIVAKKLPTTAPPASRSGPGRAGTAAGRTGVDLNKQQRSITSGDQCNC
jgi:Ras-related protein Rab-5C